MDVWEGVEIFAPAGTDLNNWKLYFYDGTNGTVYLTQNLYGVVADANGYGFGTMFFVSTAGIQNGAPDGVALVDNFNTVVQFISYEGTFNAVAGPAIGLTSEDIGVSEDGLNASGTSLQLTGSGNFYEDFTWDSIPVTPGILGSSFQIANANPTYADCVADPTVCGITPDPGDGSNQDGIDFCVANPELCGITPDPMDGSTKLGEQNCIDDPLSCGIVVGGTTIVNNVTNVNENTDGSYDVGYREGSQRCAVDPASCGIDISPAALSAGTVGVPLFVEADGGGTVFGRGIICSEKDGVLSDRDGCFEMEPFGETVYLLTVPENGWYFSSWGGHSDCVDGMVLATWSKLCIAFFRKL